MLRSMTAYGCSTLKADSGEFVCELRSVNHRYLDLSVRLPESLRSLEPSIRDNVTKTLQRGRVDITVTHLPSFGAAQPLIVDEVVLAQLVAAADQVKLLSGSSQDIDPLRLLGWSGVLTSSPDLQDLMAKDAMAVFRSALTDFVDARAREGALVSNLLSEKTALLSELIAEVRSCRPMVIERQKEKWLAKLAQLKQGFDESRLEQELVYAAQRLDIDEELDRLVSHCAELSNALGRTDSVGRRLDFLMQEFNREANTLTAKSGDNITTNAAVEMKVIIEQMREQVQNVE